jgi:hypothetical protein
MRTYNLIRHILRDFPDTRNSDKELQWKIWEKQGAVRDGVLTKQNWIYKAKLAETVRRTRQKIQERHPELKPVKEIEALREEKEASRGTWIFNDETQTAILV